MSRDRAGLREVLDFLPCATTPVWFDQALDHLPTLLVDHANCEKKAASTALGLMFRYVDKPDLMHRMSRLAREELRHFEQVHDLLIARGISYDHLSPSRYAARLMGCVRQREPFRLSDTLLVGAVVEARSCERFAGLADVLPADLGNFYRRLLDSEARHFRHYLALAERYANGSVTARLDEILALEARLITMPDEQIRFHSGPLQAQQHTLRAEGAGSAG
jgi:tRNA 2-(methylsulfanyl)-N6-isopentenyladenosine37 hydroxylase